MKDKEQFDVIIIGGSYSGLAAGMALGRALKKVLIIDAGNPCNRQTPYSHNLLTHDGKTPTQIAKLAKQQVEMYKTVAFFQGMATSGRKTENGFEIQTEAGKSFTAKKLIFATGIRDIMPDIPGFSACWGISVLHCPYCHGYEVRNERTAILGNGDPGYELAGLVYNWANDVTLFTNGTSTLIVEQIQQLKKHQIEVVEKKIEKLVHTNGHLDKIVFNDGSNTSFSVMYAPVPFEQHCNIVELLGCELTDDGYIKVDPFQETTIKGVFACGDNTTKMRTLANAIAMGTTAGIAVSKKMILEAF